MDILKLLRNNYFWLVLIIILGLVVRLYKIDSPIADWHSWRQADTAAVTRNFLKEGFDPFLPKYDDMSANSDTSIPNPARFRFVEFPLYNIFVYPLYLFFGTNVVFDRLVSVIFSLASLVLLYFISKKYVGEFAALLTAFIFAILPYNVYYSRTTLPEPTFVFFALGMIYFVDKWMEEKGLVWGIWGFIFTALAFLIKPWAIFFYLPLLYLSLKKRIFKKFLIFSIFAFIPFILWRIWILQQPEGIPASSWLLNSDGIRFKPAFFWWIFSERLGREILSVSGLILFIIGVILKPKDGNYFLHLWLLSALLFMVIFATGNVRHDYYQIMFIPTAAIFFSKGFLEIMKGGGNFIARVWLIPLGLFLFISSFYFGYKQVIELYKINNPAMVEAGKLADTILPKDAKVVAPYNGDSAFLYQTNRPGFAFVPTSIKDLIANYGINYYISTSYDNKTNWVLRHFYSIAQNPKFVIADLTKVKKNFDSSDPEP